MSNEPENYEAQLAQIRASKHFVRDRVAAGSWRYDLVYSSIAAAMVAGQAAPMPLNVLASAGGALAFGLLWRHWSEKTGISVTGVSPKRARWVGIALGGFLALLMLAGLYAGLRDEPIWALPLGAVAFVAALGSSRLWLRVYKAETEAGE